jgi:hypothetical protein
MSALPPKADINLCQAVFEKTKAKLAPVIGKTDYLTPAPPKVKFENAKKRPLLCPQFFYCRGGKQPDGTHDSSNL